MSKRTAALERDRWDRIVMETRCPACDYSEDDGELFRHCHNCACKIIRKVNRILHDWNTRTEVKG
jgi:hypothetical protein